MGSRYSTTLTQEQINIWFAEAQKIKAQNPSPQAPPPDPYMIGEFEVSTGINLDRTRTFYRDNKDINEKFGNEITDDEKKQLEKSRSNPEKLKYISSRIRVIEELISIINSRIPQEQKPRLVKNFFEEAKKYYKAENPDGSGNGFHLDELLGAAKKIYKNDPRKLHMITFNPDLVYLDPVILSSASSELENRLEQLKQINSLPTEHRKRNDLNQVEKVVARLADLGIGSMFTISTTYGTLLKGIKWLLRDSKKTDLENYLEGGVKRFFFGNATTSRYGYNQIKTIASRKRIQEFGDDLITILSNQSNPAGKFAKVGRGLGFLTKMAIRKFPLLALAASVGSWLYMNNPEFLKGFKDALPSLKTVKEIFWPDNIGVLFD